MSVSPRIQKYTLISLLCGGLAAGAYVAIPTFSGRDFSMQYNSGAVKSEAVIPTVEEEKKVLHIETPEQVKAIYMSQCVVGTKSFRERLVEIADTTEINSIIIDIKDYTGKIGFVTDNPKLSAAVSNTCGAVDIEEFIELLHSKGIYVIGRVTVFQDPYMVSVYPHLAVQSKSTGTPWEDYKGLSFIDVSAKQHWDYIVELSKESYNVGFDKINFDYIRFPSDGNMKDVEYIHSAGKVKSEALKEFFVYLHDNLKDTGMKTSVDLFGMTTTNKDDLNIGQVLENAFPYFDYIAPMVYPSHYPKNFNGWANPNHYIYEIVYMSMKRAFERGEEFDAQINLSKASSTIAVVAPSWYTGESAKKLRTWIQDFDYGGNYDVVEVREQIQASYDAGVDSFMIWSPSNIYTLGALEKE